jgi:hypothetical protein
MENMSMGGSEMFRVPQHAYIYIFTYIRARGGYIHIGFSVYSRAISSILPPPRTCSQFNSSELDGVSTSSIENMDSYVNKLIHAHSGRLEQYKLWLKCSASEVEQDIRQAMDDVRETIPWEMGNVQRVTIRIHLQIHWHRGTVRWLYI